MTGGRTLFLAALAPLFLVALLPGQPREPLGYPRYSQQFQQPWPNQPGPFDGTVSVYRFNNPRTGEHRYTDDPGEAQGWANSGRPQDEGVVFRLLPEEGPDLAPLYRLALPNGSTALGIMTQPGYKDPRGPVDKTLGLLSIRPQRGWVSL